MIQVNVLMKKIRRGLLVNIRYIWKVCWIKISVLFSIIGVVGSFISIPEYISYKISVVVLLLLITLCFGVSILGFIEKKTLLIFTTGNGKNVFVKFDTLFNNHIAEKSERKAIVIPVNRCFDVIANDELIASGSIHGQCLRMLIPQYYSENALNDVIQEYLKKNETTYEMLNKNQKKQGNLKRFPAGTIVPIMYGNTYFYFLAISKLDENLHAVTSDEDYITAIQKLLHYHFIHSQGYPLISPLIGSGAANMGKEQSDMLRFMISFFQLEKHLINSDIYIVIKKEQRWNISCLEAS